MAVTEVAASSSSTIPAGAAVGNLLLAFVGNQNGAVMSAPTGSGWTLITQGGNSTAWAGAFYKYATSADPGSTLTINGASLYNIIAYSGVAMAPTGQSDSGGNASPAPPTMALPTNGMLASCIQTNNFGNLTPPSGWTQRGTSNVFDSADIATAPSSWTWQSTSAGSQLTTYAGITVALSGAAAPNAPTLSAPANAAYLDVSTGVTLSGTYNPTDGANQNAYAVRIKVSGAGSYSYWNASNNALQSTIVWNAVSTAPGGSFSANLPASAVSDGNTYNWSMASQESTSNLQGPFASDFTFNAQSAPGLTVNGPSGSETTTTSPAVTWTTTPPSGASQTAYRVVVEHGAYGTTPGSGTQDWDSTLTSSSAQSATVGATLVNGTTYRAFVQVTETGGQTSGWGYTTFTVTLDAPATPGITATPGTDPTTGAPRVTLQINGHDNLLSAADAGFDGSVGTWTAAANTAISDSSAEALDGPSSMAVTAVASGTAQATTATYSL